VRWKGKEDNATSASGGSSSKSGPSPASPDEDMAVKRRQNWEADLKGAEAAAITQARDDAVEPQCGPPPGPASGASSSRFVAGGACAPPVAAVHRAPEESLRRESVGSRKSSLSLGLGGTWTDVAPGDGVVRSASDVFGLNAAAAAEEADARAAVPPGAAAAASAMSAPRSSPSVLLQADDADVGRDEGNRATAAAFSMNQRGDAEAQHQLLHATLSSAWRDHSDFLAAAKADRIRRGVEVDDPFLLSGRATGRSSTGSGDSHAGSAGTPNEALPQWLLEYASVSSGIVASSGATSTADAPARVGRSASPTLTHVEAPAAAAVVGTPQPQLADTGIPQRGGVLTPPSQYWEYHAAAPYYLKHADLSRCVMA
jgi:hypothetical protein